MKQWPEDDKPADFTDLVDAIFAAVRFAYTIERKNEGENIPFTGPDAPATIFNPSGSECLKIEWLGASPEDQVRTPMEVIIGIAIRLGAEQERRASKQKRLEYANSAINTIDVLSAMITSCKKNPDLLEKIDNETYLGYLKRDIAKLVN
jgi:hypothetical protein